MDEEEETKKFYDYQFKDEILYVKDKNNSGPIITINEGNKININVLNNLLKIPSRTNQISKEEKEKIIIQSIKPEFFQNHNFYTRNDRIWDYNKNLMKYILQSETMRTLLKYVYPEVFQIDGYIFNNDQILGELVDSFVFVPYNLEESYGTTIKDFMVIFINGLPPKKNTKVQKLNGSSSFQVLGIHEGAAHWASAYCSFALKNNDLFGSLCYENFPIEQFKKEFEKKELIGLDGGDILEKLLFSRIIKDTDIREILFILCRNSYEGSYISFNKKFNDISKKSLDLVYNEAIKDGFLKEYLELLDINLEYLKSLENSRMGFKMKRNGDFIRASRCNRETLKYHNFYKK